MRLAVYAGSYDPFTFGHLSVLEGAAASFDGTVVGVGQNTAKKPLFNVEERMEIIHEYLNDRQLPGVRVQPFSGLLINFCQELLNKPLIEGDLRSLPDSVTIIRGLRAVSDFEQELLIADANRRLDSRFPTLFVPTKAEQAFISSSVVKEIAFVSRDPALLTQYVPVKIAKRIVGKWATAS